MDKNPLSNSKELLDIPEPAFGIGTKVKWNSTAGDMGIVRGMRYVWNGDTQTWQYQYYIALDIASPSYEWTKFDWGWQQDLEALFLPNS